MSRNDLPHHPGQVRTLKFEQKTQKTYVLIYKENKCLLEMRANIKKIVPSINNWKNPSLFSGSFDNFPMRRERDHCLNTVRAYISRGRGRLALTPVEKVVRTPLP